MTIQAHEDKQISITIASRGNVQGILTNARHTYPPVTTTWWPDTVIDLIKKELLSPTVVAITMVEINNVF